MSCSTSQLFAKQWTLYTFDRIHWVVCTYTRQFSGIRTHDLSVRAVKDRTWPLQLGRITKFCQMLPNISWRCTNLAAEAGEMWVKFVNPCIGAANTWSYNSLDNFYCAMMQYSEVRLALMCGLFGFKLKTGFLAPSRCILLCLWHISHAHCDMVTLWIPNL